MVLAAALTAPKPAFFVKIVRSERTDSTNVLDARRDLSLVGTTTNWSGTSSLYVRRGRAAFSRGINDLRHFLPSTLTARGFSVRTRNGMREGRIFRGEIVLGDAIVRSPSPQLSIPPTREAWIRFDRELWPIKGATFDPKLFVQWWRLSGGAVVGTGGANPHYPDPDRPYTSYDTRRASVVELPNGRIVRLDSLVRGGPIRLLGILYVSPEGWLIAEAGATDLAWLYPIPR